MTGLLEGKAALVTGGASGLGNSIAKHFQAAGAGGVIMDIDAAGSTTPGEWTAVTGDVSSESDVRAALAEVKKRFGQLDVVVANAGLVPPWHATEDIDLDEWDRVFAVNVKGIAVTLKHAVPMMKSAGGSVIAMGSLNSRRAHPSQCLYTASKHAVLGIVRSAALDLGRYGIRVNALGPGPVATDALVSRVEFRAQQGGPPPSEAFAGYAAETALGRLASEDDVAKAALFLASDASSGITGQILPVDAGLA